MEQLLEQSLLYDYYGELLTNRQKDIYEQYVIEDLSLGEIAEINQISRQAVHDQVKRVEKALLGYEEKLHLVKRFLSIRMKIQEMQLLLDDIETEQKSGLKVEYSDKFIYKLRSKMDLIVEEI